MSTRNKLLSILLLIFLWPIGLILLIKKKPFRKISSILIGIITLFAFFIFLGLVFTPNPTTPNTASTKQTITNQIPIAVTPKSSTDTTKQVKSKDTTSSSDSSTDSTVKQTKSTNTISENTTSDETSPKPKLDVVTPKTTTSDDDSSYHHTTSTNDSVKHTTPAPQAGETGTIHFDSHTKEVILHSSPGSHTIEIEHLEDGTTVSILGKGRAYYHVSVDGETGYVYDRYVDLN